MSGNDHESSDQPERLSYVRLHKRDVEDAARILAAIVSGSPQTDSPLRNGPELATRSSMRERAKTTFLNRRRRVQIFGPSMFGEPAWDMLLSLYISEQV